MIGLEIGRCSGGTGGGADLEIHGMAGHHIRRLHQISTQVFQHRAQQAGFDLTPVQFAAMDAVNANPGLDQASVAALIAYDRATIGGVIDRLARKGYVTRTTSRQDRRARVVTLTAAGKAVFDAFTPVVAGFQDEILAGLDPDERGRFMSLLLKAVGSGAAEAAVDSG